MAEQSFWVPLPSCSPPGRPFPVKSLALPAHVSPWTIHFLVLDKSPVSGPGRGPPSCNTFRALPFTGRDWHGNRLLQQYSDKRASTQASGGCLRDQGKGSKESQGGPESLFRWGSGTGARWARRESRWHQAKGS